MVPETSELVYLMGLEENHRRESAREWGTRAKRGEEEGVENEPSHLEGELFDDRLSKLLDLDLKVLSK